MYKIENNIYAKETGIYGKSLFAKKNFKKDEVVFVAFGPITKVDSYHTIPISNDLYIEPRKPKDNLSQYICHSCEPNLGVKKRSIFVAMQDIRKGEEVVIDYAMIVPRFPDSAAGNIWPGWECKCGKKTCRGKVKGYLDLTEEEKKKYSEYVSDFIIEIENKTT